MVTFDFEREWPTVCSAKKRRHSSTKIDNFPINFRFILYRVEKSLSVQWKTFINASVLDRASHKKPLNICRRFFCLVYDTCISNIFPGKLINCRKTAMTALNVREVSSSEIEWKSQSFIYFACVWLNIVQELTFGSQTFSVFAYVNVFTGISSIVIKDT